ncbi:threonine synthase [Christiangramia gaetbulicola]|uniref:Threonine synthase n=1 Tax=Christiangramia gaetbulicola TaxID=703340 RepID=A0A2T6AFP8_9FLAO|nr:threonine synthase [Christiangramia gaetbulicola]PTX42650.1 threonine synthase [Christiangramia gaetbulicola]
MKYFSLNNREHTSNFEDAVVRGLAPDKGLYFPEEIVKLPASFFQELNKLDKTEIAFNAIQKYVGAEIPDSELMDIIDETLDFEFPVVDVEENIGSLELFHGPTLAFKDVGARFMAGSLGYFIKKGNLGKVTVLVATSGDTGGAVANGFLGVDGIDVVILYPKGKVSDIQEKQLTTLGQNITALKVDGVFDDCQKMVKQAFLDKDITEQRRLTSANSINLARWLPQMFYYFLAYRQLADKNKKLVFSVPSGNFGNICAGMLAREMGLPIDHFVAANNANDTVTNYLDTANYKPKPSVATISNAMDVGDPSNFIRVLRLFDDEYSSVKKVLSAYSFDDEATRKVMKKVYSETGYIMDPHGAVGYLGLQKYLKDKDGYYGTFLETAHPVKFLDTVEAAIGDKVEIPDVIQALMDEQKKSLQISNYEDLKGYLLS